MVALRCSSREVKVLLRVDGTGALKQPVLEANSPHHESRQHSNHQHHPAPGEGGVDQRLAAVDGLDHPGGDGFGLAGEGGRFETGGHAGFDEAGFDVERHQTLASEFVVERF